MTQHCSTIGKHRDPEENMYPLDQLAAAGRRLRRPNRHRHLLRPAQRPGAAAAAEPPYGRRAGGGGGHLSAAQAGQHGGCSWADAARAGQGGGTGHGQPGGGGRAPDAAPGLVHHLQVKSDCTSY